MTTELTNRSALVTGGASGIGLSCARMLAQAGAHVIVADRDGDGARGAAAEVGGEALVIDLSDLEAVANLSVDVDVLVNNAGVQTIAPVEEFDPLAFRRMIDLMVTAPFLLTRSALPQMYGRGWGRVVNISSVHGVRASPYKVAYVTAKHALEGMSKVVALEGGAHGVTSNCVNPGYVRTPLVEKQIADQARVHGIAPNEVLERIMLTESAIKRLLEPEEVAAQVLWLCSESAGMVTGTSHLMDGGWSAR